MPTLILKAMLVNLFRMFLGKKMVIWGLKLAASMTDTKVDDNIILLAEGAMDNDEAKVVAAIEALAANVKTNKIIEGDK